MVFSPTEPSSLPPISSDLIAQIIRDPDVQGLLFTVALVSPYILLITALADQEVVVTVILMRGELMVKRLWGIPWLSFDKIFLDVEYLTAAAKNRELECMYILYLCIVTQKPVCFK